MRKPCFFINTLNKKQAAKDLKKKESEGLQAAWTAKLVFMQLSASEISPRNFHFAADTHQRQRVSAGGCGCLIWLIM
jgi:hypothetical protein